jgi:hypothetical protein
MNPQTILNKVFKKVQTFDIVCKSFSSSLLPLVAKALDVFVEKYPKTII